MKQKAFTLAEVLVTLAIIGVVAAISVPTLISSTNNQGNIVAFKKNWAMMSQLFEGIYNENGGSLTGVCSLGAGTFRSGNCIRDLVTTNLKVIKKCDAGNYKNIYGQCWTAEGVQLNSSGAVVPTDPSQGVAGFILNDGSMYKIYWFPNSHGGILVDVNGMKAPNQNNKDIFLYQIKMDSLILWDFNDSKSTEAIQK